MLGCIARPSKPCISGEYVSLAGQSVGIGRDDQAPRIVEGLTQQKEATASLLLGQGLRVRAQAGGILLAARPHPLDFENSDWPGVAK